MNVLFWMLNNIDIIPLIHQFTNSTLHHSKPKRGICTWNEEILLKRWELWEERLLRGRNYVRKKKPKPAIKNLSAFLSIRPVVQAARLAAKPALKHTACPSPIWMKILRLPGKHPQRNGPSSVAMKTKKSMLKHNVCTVINRPALRRVQPRLCTKHRKARSSGGKINAWAVVFV